MLPRDYQPSGGYDSAKLSDYASPISQPIAIGPPIKGMDKRRKPSEIDPNQTPYCLNARVRRDYIEPRYGYTLISSSFDSTILYIREFVLSTGVVYLIIITIKSLYTSIDLATFNRVPWYYTTGTVTTDGTTAVVGVGTLWETNCRAGDRFKTATGAYVTIATVTDNTHLVLSSTYAAEAGVAYVIDRYLGGTVNDSFWGCSIPDVDYFVFSQGVDQVLYIDTAADHLHLLHADCPAAKYGTVFGDRLVIASTVEGLVTPVAYPYRIRWSAAGNYDDWTGTGSGFNDLIDDPYEITGLSVGPDICAIYKTYSVVHMVRTGKSVEPFDFKAKVPGIGCYVPGSLVSIGDADMFVGSDNFYTYDTRAIKAVGDDVKDNFLSAINPSYLPTAHSLVVEELDEAQVYYPTIDNTHPNKVIVWNYDMMCWESEWEVPTNASGYATQEVTESWDADTGAWDDDATEWDDTTILSAKPLNMIAHGTSLYKWNPSALTDDGVDFTFEWQTKDFSSDLYKYISTYRVIVEYYAQTQASLLCSLSVDGGKSFGTELSVELNYLNPSQKRRAFYDFITTGETVRIRFRCLTGGRFQIVKVVLEAIPSGDIIE